MELLRVFGRDILTGLGVFVIIAKAFEYLGKGSSDGEQREVKWLSGQLFDPRGKPLRTQRFHVWPDIFVRKFDKVFTRRHLSFRCFLRSCCVSAAVVTFLYGIILIRNLGNPESYIFGFQREFSLPIFILTVLILLVSMVLLTVVPDYISLLETRWILGRMRHRPSNLVIGGLLFLDIALTTLVLLGSIAGFAVILGILHEFGLASESMEAAKVARDGLELALGAVTWNPAFDYYTPVVYSTFFTSVWIWSYVFSGFVIRTVLRFDSVWRLLQRALNIQPEPARAMGKVAGLLGALCYWLFSLCEWLLS